MGIACCQDTTIFFTKKYQIVFKCKPSNQRFAKGLIFYNSQLLNRANFGNKNGSKIQHVKVKVSLHFLTFLSDKYIRFLCNISVFFLGRSEKAANYYSISFLTCVCISVNTEEEATPESRAEEPIERQQPRRRGHYLATYKEIFLSEDLVLLLFF